MKEDQLQRRYIFDDRGYLSAIRYFDDQERLLTNNI
ncbi:accessory Sec system glycosyltransferase Asp1 [Staphylococcus aureus]